MMILIRIFILLNVLIGIASAQEPADSSKKTSKTVFKIGTFYNSYLHYYGRTDSLKSGGLFVLAELWIDRHFYISAAPIFVTVKGQHPSYAGSLLMAGYRFGNENKSIANIYGLRPIYRSNTTLVQSALKAQFGATATFIGKFVNVTIGGDLKWSDDFDLGTQIGIDHLFRFKLDNNTVLALDPTMSLNAGTQRFTKTYFKQSGFLLFPGSQQQVTERVREFNTLSYEFSVPIILASGKMQFIFSPAYVIPKNKIGERGDDKLYALLGARLTL